MHKSKVRSSNFFKFRFFDFNLVVFLICILFIVVLLIRVLSNYVTSVIKVKDVLNRTEILQAERGSIYDKTSKVLAYDQVLYRVLKLQQVNENCKTIIYQGRNFCVLYDSASDDDLDRFISSNYTSSTKLIKLFNRVYPYTDLTYHFLGYLQNDSLERFSPIGVERHYQKQLSGINGFIESYLDSEYVVEPVRGNDLYLTLDIEWQITLNNLLSNYAKLVDAASYAAIIVDNSDGSILSYISQPSIDPENLVHSYYLYKQDKRGLPYMDKVVTVKSAPGSIFKPISSYFLLSKNIVEESTLVDSTGCIYFNDRDRFCEFSQNRYGLLNLRSALARSSNIFFCQSLIKNTSNFADFSKDIYDIAIAFNMFNGTVTTFFLDVHANLYLTGLFQGDLCNYIIGQGSLVLTPINVLNVYSIFGERRGNWKNAKIVKDENYNIDKNIYLDLNMEYISLIRQGLKDAVYSVTGTTYSSLGNMKDFNIIAKTGTAESQEYRFNRLVNTTHGWIAGVFQLDGREYAFVLHTRHGGGGYGLSFVLRDFLNCINKNVRC